MDDDSRVLSQCRQCRLSEAPPGSQAMENVDVSPFEGVVLCSLAGQPRLSIIRTVKGSGRQVRGPVSLLPCLWVGVEIARASRMLPHSRPVMGSWILLRAVCVIASCKWVPTLQRFTVNHFPSPSGIQLF